MSAEQKLIRNYTTNKLKRKVECYHKIGAEKHEPIVVNGNKTIDLNGYELGCKDHTNADDQGCLF